jgi:hypothetical protein
MKLLNRVSNRQKFPLMHRYQELVVMATACALAALAGQALAAASAKSESAVAPNLAVLPAVHPQTTGDALEFVETKDGIFGRVDLVTGDFTQIADNGSKITSGSFAGFGVANGTLYATDYHQPHGTLYSVNTTTGVPTAIGSSTVNYEVFGSTAAGVLYAGGVDNNLYTIDPATGAATVVAPVGVSIANFNGGFSTGAALLYLVIDTNLYKINTSTGAATLVGATGGPQMTALAFDNNVLWGGQAIPSFAVATINASSGVATTGPAVTGTNAGDFFAMAPDPIPVIATSTTLSASPTSAPYGTLISFIALVKASTGTTTPKGSVKFEDGSTVLGTVTLNSTGQGTLSTKFLPVGSDSVVAIYSGSTGFSASTSNAVKVTIAAAPVVTLSPGSVAFPATQVGSTSEAEVITLTNAGKSPLSIRSLTITGTNPTSFIAFNNCGPSIAVGKSCDIIVGFVPTKVGTLGAKLTLTDNAAGSPQTVTLTGSGVAVPSLTFSPSSVSFPATAVGAAAPEQAVAVTNPGSTPVTIDSIAINGADPADFRVLSTCGGTLAAKASCTIYVEFAPKTAGALTASVTIADSAAGSPQAIKLSGTGT